MLPALSQGWFRTSDGLFFALRLHIPPSAHVYAHEPGFGAKPTTIELRGFNELSVEYPPGEERKIAGFSGPVRVYASDVTFVARISASATGSAAGTLSFVLCRGRECRPYRLAFSAPVPLAEERGLLP